MLGKLFIIFWGWVTASFLFLTTSSAQFSLIIGITGYQGDLNEKYYFQINKNNLAGISYNYPLKEDLSLELTFLTGTFSGSDLISKKEWRIKRGYSFQSNFKELNLSIKKVILVKPLNIELSIGLGCFTNKFKTIYNKDSINLDKFAVKNNKLYSIVIPIEMSVNYPFDNFSISLNCSQRKLFSDYLDGVSLSGNPKKQDWYGIISIKFTKLKDKIKCYKF